MPRGEAGAGMDKAGVSLRQCHRDPGADQPALTGGEHDVLCRVQVGTGVIGVSVRRQLETGIELEGGYGQPIAGRGGRGFARIVHPDTLLEMASPTAAAKAAGRRVEISQYGTGSSASSRVTSTAP